MMIHFVQQQRRAILFYRAVDSGDGDIGGLQRGGHKLADDIEQGRLTAPLFRALDSQNRRVLGRVMSMRE